MEKGKIYKSDAVGGRVEVQQLAIHCPGCDIDHLVNIKGPEPLWDWNGSLEKPTIAPSILVRYPWGPKRKEIRCHSFVRDGKIQFLNDCTHHLAGQTVELPEISH